MRQRTAVVLVLVLAACGASRDQVIRRTATALDAARQYYSAEDEAMQMQILADEPERSKFEERIQAHRLRQAQGTIAFRAAWAALAAAALEPSDMNMGRLTELAGKAIATLTQGAKP